MNSDIVNHVFRLQQTKHCNMNFDIANHISDYNKLQHCFNVRSN